MPPEPKVANLPGLGSRRGVLPQARFPMPFGVLPSPLRRDVPRSDLALALPREWEPFEPVIENLGQRFLGTQFWAKMRRSSV